MTHFGSGGTGTWCGDGRSISKIALEDGRYYTTSTTVNKSAIDALLDHFPGPLTIGFSIWRHLLVLPGASLFVVGGIWMIQSAGAIATTLASRHAQSGYLGLLRLLIYLRAARDLPQAVAEAGAFVLIFGGLVALIVITSLVCSVAGLTGLTLDKNGFLVKGLKRNSRYGWADVGDFDTVELPRSRGRWPLSMRCVMFNDYRAPETPIVWLRLAGRNRALVASYEYSAEVLASAMSIWREWALRDRASKDR